MCMTKDPVGGSGGAETSLQPVEGSSSAYKEYYSPCSTTESMNQTNQKQ